jgi:DinB family protein
MNRTQIEAKLNRDRAWLIETYAAVPGEDLLRAATRSEHDPSAFWSAKDHLAHLSGIEKNFNRMIRRHFDGAENPVGLRTNADGSVRTRDEIMAGVHAMTEAWVLEHREKSLDEVVALGQQVRAETLALLASLSEARLAEKLPGAPWADGSVGGVLAVNADHGRMHWRWVRDGLAAGVGPEASADPT